MKDPSNISQSSSPVPAAEPPQTKDETVNGAAVSPNPVIEQAKRDIDAGLVDTDMRATPGLDAKRRAQLVPGPAGKAPKVESA